VNEKELTQYVKQLNTDIELRNMGKPPQEREELYNIKKVLKGYHRIKWNDDVKEFRKQHDCNYCFYYTKPRRCKAIKSCPLEMGEGFNYEEKDIKKCPKDAEGNCQYGRGVEKCVGYCIKDMVKEHREQWAFRYGKKS